jgi:phosphate transport system permease protein
MTQEDIDTKDLYPQGDDLEKQIRGRHRVGSLWRNLFILATVTAIIVLMVLLLTIINQSFGLTAVQSEFPEEDLVRQYYSEEILTASNVEASEDDQKLANNIGATANSTGFFGYAFYINNTDKLKALSLDGIAPSAETANSGQYPLTRPLYIYTSQDILEERPQVASFINFYLENMNEVVDTIGYFPVDAELEAESKQILADALAEAGVQAGDPAQASGNIVATGSSTVFPVSGAMAEGFKAAGFGGSVDVGSIGTGGGFNAFCKENLPDIDIVNASRPVSQLEFDACRVNGRQLVEFRIGTDALAVVVNKDADFVDNVSLEEAQRMYIETTNWSEVNPSWPEEPISRFVPTQFSGTMDFFIDEVYHQELSDLSSAILVGILQDNISTGLGRRLERDQRFFEDRLVFEDPALWEEVCASETPSTGCTLPARSQQDIYRLVQERVVVPAVVEAWFLVDSIFNRDEIVLEAASKYPNAQLEFRSWLSPEFVVSPQSSTPELAGIRTALLGTLWVILITMLVSFPVGVGAAIYLEEYADHTKWYNRIIQTNINNLAGVPSIIYGMLGLAVFVRVLEPITSGAAFGVVEAGATANGRTVLSAGLTLALLILPIIIIAAQESIRAVPSSLRQASYGLGATRWQTIWNHVLPNALPGILTGTIISMSRAIGETAPLVVVGASTFITVDPTGPFSKFTVLPIQIFQWTTRPQSTFRNIAGAAIIILLILLLVLNASAVIIRNRTSKRMG